MLDDAHHVLLFQEPISGRSNTLCRPSRPAISRLGDGPDYEAVLPPFTLMIWPVMNDALRDATNTMASAISAGYPRA
jgi:hypothetical protein